MRTVLRSPGRSPVNRFVLSRHVDPRVARDLHANIRELDTHAWRSATLWSRRDTDNVKPTTPDHYIIGATPGCIQPGQALLGTVRIRTSCNPRGPVTARPNRWRVPTRWRRGMLSD